MVVDCYVYAYFMWLQGYEPPQDAICSNIRTGFVVTFTNLPILLDSKLQKNISLYNFYYEYVALYNSFKDLIPLKTIIKEVVDNLVMDSDTMKFISSSGVYEDNNGTIVVVTSSRMTNTSNPNYVKYHWFRKYAGK